MRGGGWRVELAMRWLSMAALAVGCTSTVAEDYAVDDERLVLWSEGQLVPDGERVEDVIAEAELPGDGRPRIRIEIDPDSCFPSYTATGFPAIDLQAGRVVVPLAFTLQMSNRPGELDLVWFDMATGEEVGRDVLLDEEYELPESEGDGQVDCRGVTATLRGAVRAANRELRSRSWTTMEPLPVELYESDDDDVVYREHIRPSERPVQVVLQHGHAVARVRGIEVLERHDVDNRMTMVHRVYAHRPSGTVLFGARDCEGDSCTCDPRSRAAVLHWRPETFAAIDDRPCVFERSPGNDRNTCDWRPVPFADAADTPLWEL
jgi:hypothetical protein